VHHTTVFPRVQIRAGTDRIVAHVGAWVLGDLADRSGWTRGLSEALAPLKQALSSRSWAACGRDPGAVRRVRALRPFSCLSATRGVIGVSPETAAPRA
jgi:hypothetical protein